MMNTKELIHNHLMKTSRVARVKKLTSAEVAQLIKEYHNSINNVLLDTGVANISDDIKVEVVRLKKRNHVLRGQPYHNWRKYKLKLTVSWDYYQKIEESFKDLLEG